jgi:medium-chain acyl-[acyl-carrier-protein] hydrolase
VSTLYLFGVPYAGGSATAIYSRWARYLPRHVTIAPLELAGHGRRMGEPFHESLEDAVGDLMRTVTPVAASSPYAIYGHSMGSVVTYELVKALSTAGLPPPRAAVLSGRNPPHLSSTGGPLHLLSDSRFLDEIRRIGGTPDEFFERRELVRAFLPILRSDYRLVERYRFSEPAHVMDTDLMFLYSDADTLVTKPEVYGWARYAAGRFALREFPGGHFFVNDFGEEICRLVTAWLSDADPGEVVVRGGTRTSASWFRGARPVGPFNDAESGTA